MSDDDHGPVEAFRFELCTAGSGPPPTNMKRLISLPAGGHITILEGGQDFLAPGAVLRALPEGGLAIEIPDDGISRIITPRPPAI